jgi:membrane protein implicated in regulation of membrane protease activity
MSLEFLSGLALVIVTLAALVYVIRELEWFKGVDLRLVRHNLVDAVERYSSREAKPVNDHLIGLTGKVTARTEDTARPLSIRVNMEHWPARLASPADGVASVGTSVKVVEVDGPVLVVEAIDD